MPQSAVITCPKCNEPIELTEALAAPMLATARADYTNKLQQKQEELAQQQAAAEQAKADTEKVRQDLAREKTALEQQRREDAQNLQAEIERKTAEAVQTKLVTERKLIADNERRLAEQRVAEEKAEQERLAKESADHIERLTRKLTEAQNDAAEVRKLKREIEEREREMPLQIEEAVSGRLETIRADAQTQAEEKLSLQLRDKEQANADLRKQIEELQRKAQQGSQQAQGETLEIMLEEQLRRKFPFDLIEPVAKGESGADVLQIVRDESGRECGRILWESKRTKAWSHGWLGKLRTDQRREHADLAVLISQAMPPDVQHFSEVDGVWVSSLTCTVPVASALRASLLQLGSFRRASEGQQTKSELVYAYLTGPRFRARIQAIAERWQEMQDDLNAEKKSTLKRWAKREAQLHQLVESTTGMYGDLQGIAGRDVVEIQALEEPLMLES